METLEQQVIGIDPGAGNMKIYAGGRGTVLSAQVALNTEENLHVDIGRQGRAPLLVHVPSGYPNGYYVTSTSWQWGTPVSNVDFERFGGDTAIEAVLGGALTRHDRNARRQGDPGFDYARMVSAVVGLPQRAVSGERRSDQAVKTWLGDGFDWTVGESDFVFRTKNVRVATQAVCALHDWLLDDDAQPLNNRWEIYQQHEVAVLSLGMSTTELLVMANRNQIASLSATVPIGLRDMLVRTDSNREIAQIDDLYRNGLLDVSRVRPDHWTRLIGAIEERWRLGRWESFGVIICFGGGALEYRNELVRRFRSRAFIPNDPLLAVARGAYKIGLMTARNGRKKRD